MTTDKHMETARLLLADVELNCRGWPADYDALIELIATALESAELNGQAKLLLAIADIRIKSGVGDKPMLDELADAIAERIDVAEREGMRRAADILRDGFSNPVAHSWRRDEKPSKNDKCPHGFYMYQDCEQCAIAAILSEIEGGGA